MIENLTLIGIGIALGVVLTAIVLLLIARFKISRMRSRLDQVETILGPGSVTAKKLRESAITEERIVSGEIDFDSPVYPVPPIETEKSE